MPRRKEPTYNKPRAVRWTKARRARPGDVDLPDDLEEIRQRAKPYKALRDRVFRTVKDPAAREQLLTGGH